MGGGASKRVESMLQRSSLFQTAVSRSFQECLDLAHHSSSEIFAYQLLDAATRTFLLIPPHHPDPASLLKDKWLPSPPTRSAVDRTIRQEGILNDGKQTLSLEDFRFFAGCVFRDMILTAIEQRLALNVPVGALGLLVAHFTAMRLPMIGPIYQSAGFLMHGLLVGSLLGAVTVSQLNFP